MNPILSASLTNCHVTGLDSIVFKESAPMVRVYVAHVNHVLWRNNPEDGHIMSLGFHQHRQDITMVPLFGTVCNVHPDLLVRNKPKYQFYGYSYSSQIADGKGGFTRLRDGIDNGMTYSIQQLDVPTFLKGDMPHSVYVPKGETAAWMICEGRPNEYYDSALWTNDPNLESADLSGLYQPMTEESLAMNMSLLSL